MIKIDTFRMCGARFSWLESVVGENGEITRVKCIVCNRIERRENLLAPNIDFLLIHARRRKATHEGHGVHVGQLFQSNDCQHMKNERLYTMKHINIVLNQFVASSIVESNLENAIFCVVSFANHEETHYLLCEHENVV